MLIRFTIHFKTQIENYKKFSFPWLWFQTIFNHFLLLSCWIKLNIHISIVIFHDSSIWQSWSIILFSNLIKLSHKLYMDHEWLKHLLSEQKWCSAASVLYNHTDKVIDRNSARLFSVSSETEPTEAHFCQYYFKKILWVIIRRFKKTSSY